MRLFSACVLVGLGCHAVAAAQDGLTGSHDADVTPALSMASASDWSVMRWTTANGLPQNSVTGITEDPSGMLWLTTFGGLVRFDGLEMKVVSVADNPALGTDRLLSAYCDAAGTLWIGTENHGLHCRIGRTIRPVPGPAILESLSVFRIRPGHHGDLWLATLRGVGHVRDNRVEFPWPDVTMQVNDVVSAADGSIYAATVEGVSALFADGAHHWAGPVMSAICIGAQGRVVAGGPEGCWELTDAGLSPIRDADLNVRDLLVGADGSILIATDGAVRRLGDHRPTVDGDHLGPDLEPRRLWQDRSGRLWIGGDAGGLACCRRADLVRCDLGHVTLVTADRDGGYYFGRGGLVGHVDAAGRRRTVTVEAEEVNALAVDADGDLLCGHASTLTRFHCGERTEIWRGDTRADARICSIFVDGGDLWFGTDIGIVLRQSAGTLRRFDFAGKEGKIHCFLRGAGALWIGTSRGICRSSDDGQTWQTLRAGTDIAAGEVRGIVEDHDGAIWIGSYGGGLTYCIGNSTHIVRREDGLPSDAVCQLEIDREKDELLINTNAGLCTALLSDLRAFVRGHAPATACRRMVSPRSITAEANGYKWPSSTRCSDGTWLFCTIDDVVALPRRHDLAPPTPLTAHVEETRFGADSGHDGDVDRTRHVCFRFTAAALESASFVMFRHRLNGRDADWVDDGHVRSIEYFDLDPGDYSFEVQAAGPGASWGDADSVSFTVHPAWHERTTTWLAALLMTVLMILGIARFAARRQRRHSRVLESAVKLRTAELEAEIERRRAAEEHLHRARESLEQRVAERTTELSTALGQLERDNQQRAELQHQVDALQRMDSIGRLAGGIAHDFNNLLTVVLNAAALLRTASPGDAGTADLLAGIERAGHQGSRLTQQLLTFARRQAVSSEVLDLGELIRTCAGMLRRVVADNIAFDLELGREPIVIEADRAQLEQVLLNLCVNARDAMPNGGTLTVELSPLDRAGDGRRRCALRVIDTGEGMSEEVRSRACEPFFSTKHRATNSGLGLSTCYGIVRRLDGELRIDSTPGKGTAITVVLPCSDKPLAARTVELPRPRPLTGVGLLIEDDADVRTSLAHLLTRHGARIVQAESGSAALLELERGLQADYVVTDLVMPGPQGLELTAAIRGLRPNMAIVFVSGDPAADDAQSRLRAAGFEVVQKPPEAAQLVAAIHRARRFADALEQATRS